MSLAVMEDVQQRVIGRRGALGRYPMSDSCPTFHPRLLRSTGTFGVLSSFAVLYFDPAYSPECPWYIPVKGFLLDASDWWGR